MSINFILLTENILCIKTLQFIIVIFILLATNSACEGFSTAKGLICDLKTKKPIVSIKCHVLSGTETCYTDVSGYYEVSNEFGGCIPKCKEIIVEFSKNGYKTKRITNPVSDTIYLEKN